MLSKTPRYYAVLAGTFAALAAAFVACATQLQVPVATSTAIPGSSQQDSAPDAASDTITADPPQLLKGVSGGDASRKPNPRGGPVTFNADQVNCSPDGKSCKFSGHVKVSSKEFVMLADKAKMNSADPGSWVLRGTPATFTHTPSSGAAVVRGAAERIVLDGAAGEVRLTGNASLTQGDAATVTGERLNYKFP